MLCSIAAGFSPQLAAGFVCDACIVHAVVDCLSFGAWLLLVAHAWADRQHCFFLQAGSATSDAETLGRAKAL